jgi:hypothetical protein
MSLAAKERYPPVNCKDVKAYFTTDTGIRYEKWEDKAFNSYTKNLEKIN